MTKYNQDDTFYSDSDRDLQFELDNTADLPNLDDVIEAVWEMRKAAGSPVILSKSIGSGVTIVDSANRIIRVAILNTDLVQISGEFEHMLRLTVSGTPNKQQPVSVGRLTILRSIIP